MQTFKQWCSLHADVLASTLPCNEIAVQCLHESLWDLTDYRVVSTTSGGHVILARIPDRPKPPVEKLTFNHWYLQNNIQGTWEKYYVDGVNHILFVSFNKPKIDPPFDLTDYEVMASERGATVLRSR